MAKLLNLHGAYPGFMSRIVAYIATSLDGFIARPGMMISPGLIPLMPVVKIMGLPIL